MNQVRARISGGRSRQDDTPGSGVSGPVQGAAACSGSGCAPCCRRAARLVTAAGLRGVAPDLRGA
jgi:hypothetical protein